MAQEPDPLFRNWGQVLGPGVQQEGVEQDHVSGLSCQLGYVEVNSYMIGKG